MQRKVKKHTLIMLSISILLLLFAFVISIGIRNYNSPLKVTKRLQKEIDLAFSDLDSEIKLISNQDLSNKNSSFDFLNQNYKNLFSEKGIEILVYTNDTLHYWTSNAFAAPFVITSSFYPFHSEIVQTGSGFYILKRKQIHNHVIIALQLLKYNYKYSNEYLPVGFNKLFSAPDNASITLHRGEYQVQSPNGKFLFSLNFGENSELPSLAQYLIFTIYISSYLCLISALFLFFFHFGLCNKRKWILFLVLGLTILLLRALQISYRFPSQLYEIYFFNPKYFASSEILPSLGDLLINAILGLQLSYFAFKNFKIFNFRGLKYKRFKFLVPALFLVVTIVLLSALMQTISGLILNSSISFQFGNILGMQPTSHLGMISIAILLNCFLFIFHFGVKLFLPYLNDTRKFLIFIAILISTFGLLSLLTGSFDYTVVIVLITLFTIHFLLSNFHKNDKSWFGYLIPSVVILAILGTFLVNKAETSREHDRRVLLAAQLSDAKDNLAEYYFGEASRNIKNDTLLNELLGKRESDTLQSEIISYI